MPGPNVVQDNIRIEGRGVHGKKREQRLTRRVSQVFELREQGMSFREIREKLHTSDDAVRRILHDPMHIRNRLEQYNERLRSACPTAIKVVFETLNSTAPQLAGERARMAQWVLEMTKTVGKDAPVNIFLSAQNAQVNVNQEMMEAARVAAAQIRAVVSPALPPAPTPEVVTITPTEENSNGNSITSGVIDGEVPTEPV